MSIDLKKLDPAVEDLPSNVDGEFMLLYSIAVSLNKIVQKLDGELFTQPVNQYGESFTDAIQNSFVRGQRGIPTWNE